VHGVGRDKCHMVVAASVFFYRYICPNVALRPQELYPRKSEKLPEVMSEQEVEKLLSHTSDLRQKCVSGLLYGGGLRLSELCNLRISDIDSKNFQLKVRKGKGGKDRFTLLPKLLLPVLRAYYQHSRPSEYLFEGNRKGRAVHARTMQHIVGDSMIRAGFEGRGFSAHTLRHSFATHLLDSGVDLHTIKELLGHAKLETTMVYLHLQKSKRAALVSPLDRFSDV